jgi:DNA mismatch repair protein MutL
MSPIRRLSPELANQIAAGEVVERPASALKELVENSIDAGANRIHVTVDRGGKRLIRVEDDGEGMRREDAVMALERHATSKVARLEDLDSIDTLGFRGEALPSIASVSHFTLKTKPHGSQSGTELRVDGGAMGAVTEVGMPDGTVIEVTDLFYNVPARRKFLKSDRAESSQAIRAVTQLSLAYPKVGFMLTSGARRVLQCPPVRTLDERFFQVYGERSDLVEVHKSAAGVVLRGYVAALTDHGPSRGPQHIFVNRRVIKDRTIAHAVHEAYSQASIKPRTPETHLFIELSPERVDVNVHPMKAEVRFLDQSLVHELVRRAVGDALGKPSSAPLPVRPQSLASFVPMSQSIPGITQGMSAASRWAGVTDVFRRNKTSDPTSANSLGAVPAAIGSGETTIDATRPLIPLGQFRDTFIIAVDSEGVAIVDQHVAHERILFEQVMSQLAGGPLDGQRLLTPIVVDLPAAQREALSAHSTELLRLGFEVGEFGGDSVHITAVPGVLARAEAENAVRELASDVEGLDRAAGVDDVLQRLAATTACHAAVKANDRLTQEKMLYILDQLWRTEYSTVCPHGRPVVLRLTRHEIEKSFER